MTDKLSWKKLQKEHKTSDFVLLHGNCQPGQILWNNNTSDSKNSTKLLLINWENCSIGHPGADIGYFYCLMG